MIRFLVNAIVTLMVGAAGGWIAGRVMGFEGGLVLNVILGIAGSVVGGVICWIIGLYATGFIASVLISAAGACLVVFLGRKFLKI